MRGMDNDGFCYKLYVRKMSRRHRSLGSCLGLLQHGRAVTSEAV